MTTSSTQEAQDIKSIHSQTFDLPPSCIQFCPSQPGIFCVGTYYLHPKKQQEQKDEDTIANALPSEQTPASQQKRTGSLILFRLEDDNTITRLSTLPTDFAVLDIQWYPHANQGEEILAVATSTGNVGFYAVSQGASLLELEHIRTLVIDPDVLVLSILWHPTRSHVLGLTLSDGRVLLLQREGEHPLWSADAGNKMLQTEELHTHDLEAWICTFLPSSSPSTASPEDEITLLSGGDDMSLRCAHLTTQNSSPSPVWQDRKLHQAGITYLLPLPNPAPNNLVISGSYDDHIRLLSLPPVGRRRVLAELNLGGGVWRLKVLHTSSDGAVVLLASCMHAGSRIVKLVREAKADVQASENEGWRFEVLGKFEEHQSMNYGSDAVRSTNGRWRVVSTSFYDKVMCLWTWTEGDR